MAQTVLQHGEQNAMTPVTEPMLPGTVVELVEVAAENLRLVASEMGTWPPPRRYFHEKGGPQRRGAFRYFAMHQVFQGMQICKGL